MRWDSLWKLGSCLSSPVPVTMAFSPAIYGIPRDDGSNPLASFSGKTQSINSVLRDEDIAENIGTKETSTSSGSGSRSGIEVWDGVFSPNVCKELHKLAVDHSERTTGEDGYDDENDEDDSLDGSSIFVHRGYNRSPDEKLTPIEQALDSFLTAYYDGDDDEDGKEQNRNRQIVVEYWCRQEHLNLEAHADVDEVWFERSCGKNQIVLGNDPSARFRYPAIGHVLYLTKPTLGVGPTCVFPPKASILAGGGPNQQNGDVSIQNEIDSVVTVPAVPGRVLRFPGRALHAVPKPVDTWFSQHNVEEGDEDNADGDYETDDEWDDDCNDDDDDDDDDDEERSVILFNTWEASADDISDDISDDSQIGPIGVRYDPMFHVDSDIGVVEMMMSSVDMGGVEVDDDFVTGMVQYAWQQRNNQLQQWREKYSSNLRDDCKNDGDNTKGFTVYSKVLCEPRDSWKPAAIDAKPNDLHRCEDKTVGHYGTIRVPLMGDKLRRRHFSKVLRWTVPSSFVNGVNEPMKPCEFPLTK